MEDNSSFIISSVKPAGIELVSSGATCLTYKFQKWGKWFLLKRLKPDFRSNPQYVAALEREFDLGIGLNHSGIVRYFDKGVDEEGPFLIEEYVDGQTLEELIASKSLGKRDVSRLFNEIAEAVAYLHSEGIVHSDIKPANIIVAKPGGHVKLIDFGFSAHHSYSELKGGTRKYSAPEQFSPVSESDIRADVYALGKVLVEMGASGKFMRVAKKASSEEPAMRYSSIKQMQNALRPDNTLWYILGILAVLLLAGMPFLKPLILPEQRNPIVDTLVVKDTLILRDTVYSEPKAMEPTPADRYRELVRREFGKIFKSFYESYSEITDENRSELRNGYGLCVDKAMELSDKMSAEWSKRYPSYNAEFEKISGEELMGVCNRYSRDLNRYDALSRQSGL